MSQRFISVASLMVCMMLTACSSAPMTVNKPALHPLPVVWTGEDGELRRAADFFPDAAMPVRLQAVSIEGEAEAPQAMADDRARLRDDLWEAAGVDKTIAPTSGLRLDVSLETLSPASRGLNLLSAAVLFIPLDAGALTVRSRYTDATGQLVAERIDRLHGQKLRLKGALTPYGRVEPVLADWARHCSRTAACLVDGPVQIASP